MHNQHTGSAVFLIITSLRGGGDYIGYHWSVFSSIILIHKKKSLSNLHSLTCFNGTSPSLLHAWTTLHLCPILSQINHSPTILIQGAAVTLKVLLVCNPLNSPCLNRLLAVLVNWLTNQYATQQAVYKACDKNFQCRINRKNDSAQSRIPCASVTKWLTSWCTPLWLAVAL